MKLSDKEWQVLEALWQAEDGLSLGQTVEALRPATPWSRNTVLTYLTRMEAKGLVARGVVQGSDGYLSPRDNISRGEAAKLLAMIYSMDKNQFTQRPGLEFVQEPAEA